MDVNGFDRKDSLWRSKWDVRGLRAEALNPRGPLEGAGKGAAGPSTDPLPAAFAGGEIKPPTTGSLSALSLSPFRVKRNAC